MFNEKEWSDKVFEIIKRVDSLWCFFKLAEIEYLEGYIRVGSQYYEHGKVKNEKLILRTLWIADYVILKYRK